VIAAVVVVVAYLAVVVFLLAANYRIHQSPQPEPESDAAWLWDQPTDCLSDAAVDARLAEITAGIWTHR
jgi:hypothetical protein